MKKIILVKDGFNVFTVHVGGTPCSTAIFNKNAKLLRKSLVRGPHYISHTCTPGEYVVETDGEILDIQLEKIKRTPLVLDVFPETLEQIYESTNWYDIEDETEKLSYLKDGLIKYYSALSFQSRNNLIPDYKLQNAVLGVYDEKTLEAYRLTIQGFRDEFHRLKQEIEKAETLAQLKAIKANFPTEISSV